MGQTVTEGHSLYAVDGAPVVLLYGPVPAWRALSPGVTGSDVAELDVDLVALGYATQAQVPAGSDVFTPATGRAVRALQAALGQSQTGTLSLGQVVFLPTAARVTSVAATVGGTVTAGAQVLQATSTSRSVTVSLDAARQLELAAGDAVTITLPDGRTTPGVVSAVGTTATPGSSNGPPGSSPGPTTVQVAVTPLDPGATGTVDQAPVTVTVTTATVPPALAVSVTALVSTGTGTPALRLTGPGRSTRLRPVMTGIVDDATGMVQVSGSGLRAGQRVVLPGSGAAG
ncbi:MAG TPA: HlyD family efflux transporter periplasmic adaptor subunit [Acidimicrobiales bacterium]|nr:HlyD family efflux transporter periplasmic adaptor subunit [Acidimicrobiales bacterium]